MNGCLIPLSLPRCGVRWKYLFPQRQRHWYQRGLKKQLVSVGRAAQVGSWWAAASWRAAGPHWAGSAGSGQRGGVRLGEGGEVAAGSRVSTWSCCSFRWELPTPPGEISGNLCSFKTSLTLSLFLRKYSILGVGAASLDLC